MPYDAPQLLEMPTAELDSLFSSGLSGGIPDGQAKETAIMAPGTEFDGEIADFVNLFGWQGKSCDAKKGVLTNRILAGSPNTIIAKVCKDNEIRSIGPNFYLGRVYRGKNPLIHFCLQFRAAAPAQL